MIIRTAPPKTFIPAFKSIPQPAVKQLPNGLKLFSYNLGNQPVFKLELIFKLGSANIKTPAVASLACNMLREGTKGKSAEVINNLLDFYGSHLDIKSGLDYTTVSLFGRAEFLKQLLPILGEILKEPAFLTDAIEKQRRLAIQNLQISQRKTSYWSTRLLRQAIFGKDHSYARIPTVEEIESIEQSTLIEFHQQLLANFEAIIIAGSYNQAECELQLGNEFGNIQMNKVELDILPPIFQVIHTEKKLSKTSQASIALGAPAISNKNEQYPLHALVVKLFGGYFGSRLMKTLREDRGLTYGVHAYFVQLKQGEFMQISADVKLEAAQESIDIVKAEVVNLLANPITEEELHTVKQYMLGEYINDSNTAFDFAGLYKKILLQNLSENYFDHFYERIAAASLEEIESIKAEVIDQDRLITAIVA